MNTTTIETSPAARSMNVSAACFWSGVWRLSDPKISLASFAGMFLGACVAAAAGPVSWGWLVVTVLGIFAIEIAKNASGELFDIDTDAAVALPDRSPFSGGKRVLVDRLLTRRQTLGIAAVCYLAGLASGLAIVFWREPRVLWIGLIGLALAYFYNGSPVQLSRRGLGELAVAVVYGPLIVAGTYLVQQHAVSGIVLWLSVPLGLQIAAFLWINEFPDYAADRSAGKLNLVVRLGRRRAAIVFVIIQLAALIGIVALPQLGLPRLVWLGAASVIPAAAASVRLLRFPEETARIISAQKHALLTFVIFALGAGAGLAWR